jgi:nucleotidyltransferase-like protein
MDGERFVEYVADELAALSGVSAVALGGSRAQGTERPDSDWDFAVYYRGHFDPELLRELGWSGEVFAIGGWGGGVFNGGAWLEVEGRRVDVHYRDLASVEHELAEAQAGRFRIEPLMFHLVGIPSYLVVAELAMGRLLRGELPSPAYPPRLREHAPEVWWDRASRLFDYALLNFGTPGRLAQCVAMTVQASSCAAHAILANRGEWITNEKSLLVRSGLTDLDALIVEALSGEPSLERVVEGARELCQARLK